MDDRSLRISVQPGDQSTASEWDYRHALITDGRAAGFETVDPAKVDIIDPHYLVFACFRGKSARMLFAHSAGEMALVRQLMSTRQIVVKGHGYHPTLFKPPI